MQLPVSYYYLLWFASYGAEDKWLHRPNAFCPLYKHFDLFLVPLGSNSRELRTLDLYFPKSLYGTKCPLMQSASLSVFIV